MKLVPLALSFTALLGASVALAADDAASEGATLAFEGANGIAACSSCHALNGWGNLQAQGPALAGQNPGYIRNQLRAYREGTRVHESMDPVAKLITDSQIVSVSEHYAAMPAGRASQDPPKPEDAEIGQRLATRGAWDREIPACEQCHGPGGRGVGENFPRLAGQHAFYLKGQLELWRSGVRKNDPNELMKGIAERLSKREIEAITAYYATLDPNPPAKDAATPTAEAAPAPAAGSAAKEGGQP